MQIFATSSVFRRVARVVLTAALCAGSAAWAQVDAPAPRSPIDSSDRFTLQAVVFHGNAEIGNAELEAMAAGDIGRQVSLADLEGLAARITKAYRDRGYFLAQAIVPQQRIQDGRVEISVLEGRLGKVQVRLAPDAPITEERVRGILAHLPAGAALRQEPYERTMLLLSDLPGLKVQSGLEQGAETGTTDLVVEVAGNGKPWAGSIGADNYGTPAVGDARVTAMVRYDSPFGIGDDVDLRLMSSSNANQTFGRFSYEAPLGSDGLRLGAGISRVDYQLGAQFAPLDASGVADVVDVSAGYPLVRSRGRNAFLRAAIEGKRLRDVTGAVSLTSDKHLYGLSVGATWESRDALWGSGYVNASATLYAGKLEFEGAQARALDQDPAFGRHTEGQFTKLAALGSRLQSLFGRNNLYASVAGQWGDRNLDPSEKMALGGDGAVRAYSSDEVLVDTGVVGTVEWRYSASEQVVVALFYDIGSGSVSQDPLASDTRNHRTLRGTGLGVNWDAPYAITLRAALAWRIGDPPLVDADNDNPRVLVQVQKAF